MVKSKKEIEIAKKSGQITTCALLKTISAVKTGITTLELDRIAQQEILRLGGQPSFKTVPGYYHTICATIDDQVVHAPPSSCQLAEGGIVGIDVGVIYQGLHSDAAATVGVGAVSQQTAKFLKIGKETLSKAIGKAKVGGLIGDVSWTIQSNIEKAGYSVVRELTGHGVGKHLHEEPSIPCFGRPGKGEKIIEGMMLAIEVIYNQGRSDVVFDRQDNWTVRTKDGLLSGLFEATVLISKSGPIVLTRFE